MTAALSTTMPLSSLTDREFIGLRDLIHNVTGIALADGKRDMISRRLSRRVKALGLASFQAYYEYVRSGDPAEIENLTNAITTNLTYFFREAHHFEHLEKVVLPAICAGQSKRLRIWSAGCSSGEEPYSIAIGLRESIPDIEDWDVKILATDLDSEMLTRCTRGIYSRDQVRKVPLARLNRWFMKGTGVNSGHVRVKPELQSLIRFGQLNLISDWPVRGEFDVIFCRNVMIYFDKPTQAKLVDRFTNRLREEGHLFVGHSESLLNVTDRLELLKNTVYRKAR